MNISNNLVILDFELFSKVIVSFLSNYSTITLVPPFFNLASENAIFNLASE